MIETGEAAPDFTPPDQDGEGRQARQAPRRAPIIRYFYPKADTPGCTTQACGVRDHLPDYDAGGRHVLGVSPDPGKAVKNYYDKQGLNFHLLADEDHAVCGIYGVWAEKSMYGRKYWGAMRATFIIDAEGVVAARLPEGLASSTRRAVLKALAEMSGAAA